MQPRWRKRLVIVGLVLLVAALVQVAIVSRETPQTPTFNEFLGQVDAGQIQAVTMDPSAQSLDVTTTDSSTYTIGYPSNYDALYDTLAAKNVPLTVEPIEGPSMWWTLVATFLPILLIALLFIFLFAQMQGGAQRVFSFAKNRARQVGPDTPTTTFRDVAGADEAVSELREIRDFLAEPERFRRLGARIPRGVLLSGPPGTGKTLLARAVAGEAGVPFFTISGSDFVEMFVGVGASRVRDLFAQAKAASPCIIFIDEIDAVGRQRGAGMGGGHDEREQTLNQLLVEMDGFERNDATIIIAATNRPDILDPALLRPGRFDRQVVVDRPDRAGRFEIMRVHARGMPLAHEVDLDRVAAQTPGLSGADLANMLNEAALLASRREDEQVTMRDLEEAILRIVAGPERRSRVLSADERRVTAVHEMGHALVGHFLAHSDPVQKISIVSRGAALGYTISAPEQDMALTRRGQLRDQMAMILGGRAAEELVFAEQTSGAANDLERVTEMARQMVTRFGMSDVVGPRVVGADHGPVTWWDARGTSVFSERLARAVDGEIDRLVREAHSRALALLTERRDLLDTLTDALLRHETIDREQFLTMVDGDAPADVLDGVEPIDGPASRPQDAPPHASA